MKNTHSYIRHPILNAVAISFGSIIQLSTRRPLAFLPRRHRLCCATPCVTPQAVPLSRPTSSLRLRSLGVFDTLFGAVFFRDGALGLNFAGTPVALAVTSCMQHMKASGENRHSSRSAHAVHGLKSKTRQYDKKKTLLRVVYGIQTYF